MLLDARDGIRGHVGQDHQLSAARFTMHRSHNLQSAQPSCAVTRDFVDILTLFEVARTGRNGRDDFAMKHARVKLKRVRSL
jgi:hypothetical protein